MNTEFARAARHLLPPAVAYAVGAGLIPAAMQQPLVEAIIALGTVGGAWFASRKAAGK